MDNDTVGNNSLVAPTEYWNLSEAEKRELLNKCGPDGPLNSIIPESIFGLDVGEACNIHDYTFINASDQSEHYQSDLLFLNNQKSLIKQSKANQFVKSLRYAGAYLYYFAVRAYSAFQ